jgi:hypothetical protein
VPRLKRTVPFGLLRRVVYVLGEKGHARLFHESKELERLTLSKYREGVFDNLLRAQQADDSWTAGSGFSVGPVYITSLYLTILQLDKGNVPVQRR